MQNQPAAYASFRALALPHASRARAACASKSAAFHLAAALAWKSHANALR